MTLITLQDGKVVLRDGKVGTEQACCCEACNETAAFFSYKDIGLDADPDQICADALAYMEWLRDRLIARGFTGVSLRNSVPEGFSVGDENDPETCEFSVIACCENANFEDLQCEVWGDIGPIFGAFNTNVPDQLTGGEACLPLCEDNPLP
jgi:hypothetical protein